jgi:hypothetical protein
LDCKSKQEYRKSSEMVVVTTKNLCFDR